MIKRYIDNPIIVPGDVKPSHPGLKVVGIFNCGAAAYQDEILLLCRVAECSTESTEDVLKIPILDENNNYELKIVEIEKHNCDKSYHFDDSRSVWKRDALGNRKIVYLTSISHFRLARSKDGVHFTIDEKATVLPYGRDELWGIEDPRITQIEDTYYITYTSVSDMGASTSLMITKDFITYERKGVIFPPENKDVSIFPEKINGKYYAYHRPVPLAIGTPDIWLSTSTDLIRWGEHKRLLGVNPDGWENGRIGGGAPSFKTEKGWIHIYHAADAGDRYCLGAILMDENDPNTILAKTKLPLLEPEFDYETDGFFGNVVFTCGCILKDDVLHIYYGAADDKIAVATITLDELYQAFQ